jgi:hypothetical protein
LQFAVLKDVYYYGFERLLGEGLFQIGFGCDLALGDVEENIFDLQDVGEIGFNAVAVFEDFVLVAGYFEALLACRWYVRRCWRRRMKEAVWGFADLSSCAPATRW